MRPSRAPLALTAALAGLLAGCGSGEPTPSFAPNDPAGALFAPDHVVDVAIEIAPSDWTQLRGQGRTWYDIMAAPNGNCLIEPFPKPFTWFPANVTVDGVRRNGVGVRKKGFVGSLRWDRPAMKLRFDPDQSLYGLSRLTLNNSAQDATWLHQCLAYRVFAKAGVPVPWCNFARVSVNGENLGLYVHVESADRRWLRRHFARDGGDLWEGEFSDFRPGWIATFEKKGDVEDDDQTGVDRSSLEAVAAAVDTTVPDSELRSRLEAQIDLDEFMRFWAVEKILESWDGYANNVNNFLLYRNPADGRFVFSPTGTDQITAPDPNLTVRPPVSVYARGMLCNRLYSIPETRQIYAKTLQRLLDLAFDEDELLAEIDRMQALVAPVLAEAGGDLNRQARAVADLRSFVSGRRAVLLADLREGPPDWQEGPRPSPCVDLAGTIAGSFSTTFGTNTAADIFLTGSGTLTGTYRTRPLGVQRVGAWAGDGRNAPPDSWPVVGLYAQAQGGTNYRLSIEINPQWFRPGVTVSFKGAWGTVYARGELEYLNPGTLQWTHLGSLHDGWLTLEAAEPRPGAAVSGRFSLVKVILM